ncbi:hypothetical protein BH09ACT10_BH09ACT10_00280 [soil metagenome]
MSIHFPSARLASSMAAIAGIATLLSGCQSAKTNSAPPPSSVYGHIHGIAVNPGDQQIYVASHNGVFRLSNGKPALVANRQQDTMGFTLEGPNEFLASGHPAPGDATATNPLGLIRSEDLAQSWETVDFKGERDFHSIDTASGYIYAYSSDGVLLSQKNGGAWKELLTAELIDIAANPVAPEQLIATTDTGAVIRISKGKTPRPITAAPPLAFIDRTNSGGIVGVDPSGSVFSSRDEGDSWKQVAGVTGVPEALNVRADLWLVATDAGVFSSDDEGDTWQNAR